MSVLIKSLTTATGAPAVDTSQAAPATDFFNTLQYANAFYDLYVAPNDPSTKRAAIVKSIRIVNTHATATVKVTLYFNRPYLSGLNRLYRRRLLTPFNMPLPPNFVYLDDSEIALEPGDSLQAMTDTPLVVQYLIGGMERDAS